MGEGHNTAARSIRDALAATAPDTSEVLVADPYTRTNPVINRLMQKGYTAAIHKYPRLWKVAFEILSRPGVVESMGPMLAELTAAVRSMIADFKPDVLVSTYPVFSFLVAKIRRADPSIPPLFTVVTDSTIINSSWYRCQCEGFLVADEPTAAVLRDGGVPGSHVHVTGFPVSPAFDDLRPCAPPSGGPWKAVFFPSGKTRRALETLRCLAAVGDLEVTVVTGRSRAIHEAVAGAGLPARGSLVGWTDRMPELMVGHHLFIGKAGGATVQEAIAAQIPFLVSHVVPGQEEGNIALIERSGIGALAVGKPARVADVIKGAFANEGRVWRAWRDNLSRIAQPGAARAIAHFLIDRHREEPSA
jgi:processive 1,2-diacylglycerol beta-glucosyltransferase